MDLVVTREMLSKHIGGVHVSSNFANYNFSHADLLLDPQLVVFQGSELA